MSKPSSAGARAIVRSLDMRSRGNVKISKLTEGVNITPYLGEDPPLYLVRKKGSGIIGCVRSEPYLRGRVWSYAVETEALADRKWSWSYATSTDAVLELLKALASA